MNLQGDEKGIGKKLGMNSKGTGANWEAKKKKRSMNLEVTEKRIGSNKEGSSNPQVPFQLIKILSVFLVSSHSIYRFFYKIFSASFINSFPVSSIC